MWDFLTGYAGPALFVVTLLATGFVGGVLASRRRIAVVEVSGVSMLPALRPGERVLVRRVSAARVRTGDIVVYRVPELLRQSAYADRRYRDSWRIKRVAATPGEPIGGIPHPGTGIGPVLPGGCLFVVGDNAAQSIDSRHTGPVAWDDVYGVVWRRRPHPEPGYPPDAA